jgi:hypothetical protein
MSIQSFSERKINWNEETFFYILGINGLNKFGITSDFDRRLKAYRREVGDVDIQLLKKELYDKRWKAELIEQLVKWRLRPWCFNGRHEWINASVQIVLDCYRETRDIVTPEFSKYEYIHKTGNDRWGYYKQIVDMTFKI